MAWRDGKIQLVISTDILKEYQRVANELSQQFPGVDISEILDLFMVEAEITQAEEGTEAAAATAGGCFPAGIEVLTVGGPRAIETQCHLPRRTFDEGRLSDGSKLTCGLTLQQPENLRQAVMCASSLPSDELT